MDTSSLARLLSLTLVGAVSSSLSCQAIRTYMPEEEALHEGTWLQWPHHHTYGNQYRSRLDATWVAMTRALVQSENVHIIAYDATERARITNLLAQGNVALTKVDFLLRRTDDCWVRDNGPVFVYGPDGDLQITDWGFNGWGLNTPYLLDDPVPAAVATAVGVPRVDLGSMVLEGGAVEVDGNGVLMATRSSILEPARNPGMSQALAESILTANLGVTKFIWLNGRHGGSQEITDMHIDGFAKFCEPRTIVTMSSADLTYWGLPAADISTLYAATDRNGQPYDFVHLPLTVNDVTTTYGLNLGYKGSYANYYVANTVVLVPTYSDPNDAAAIALLRQQYPFRTVVGIDVRNLYRNGGMIHCVTQQEPVAAPGGLGVRVGAGCASPALRLDAFAVPNIGRTMVFGLDNVPANTVYSALMIGRPQALSLAHLGMQNCWLYTTADLGTLPMTVSRQAGSGVAHLAIPFVPAAVGFVLSLQAGVIAPGATSLGVVTSNGITLTIAN